VTSRHPRVLPCAEIGWEGATPRSALRGDVYFSRRGGVEESRLLFLEGNDLQARLALTRDRFCIGETGFGTGLNFLVARRRFLEAAPGSAELHFVSMEHAPVSRADRARFAATLEQSGHARLAVDARLLDARLPSPVQGWHRIVLDGGRVRLSLWLGEADAGLLDWARQGRHSVDAWFLDGFAPSLNPELWTPALTRQLADLSHRETTLSTFSVARTVRDALGAAGFAVTRAPGPPGKREMLVGRGSAQWPRRPAPASARPATVIGAGLAGASSARALAERGHTVLVRDAVGPAAGASGNRHAVLHPRLPADGSDRAALLLTAHGFARSWLDDPLWAAAFTAREVVQFTEPRRPERLGRVRASFGDLDGLLAWDGEGAALRMRWPDAGHVDLPRLIESLLDHPAITLEVAPVDALSTGDGGAAGLTVLAAGAATAGLVDPPLPLGRMRGQLTQMRAVVPPNVPVLTGRGHAVPLGDLWSVGSSYVRDGDDGPPTAGERAANVERLRAWLAVLGAPDAPLEVCADWTGVRATAPDRSPLVGELDRDLWVSAAHASSGLVTCPLAAEAIAARLAGEPPVLDADLEALLAPRRFLS
jgi:tRNA 5-methylaminomethyl-2-thiouridine biosynthesis bifunctional protein